MSAPARAGRWSGDGSALTLRVLVDEAVRRGLDPAPLLADVGLGRHDADDPLGRIARDTIFAFAENVAAVARDPAFHLVATARARIGAFGAVDFVVTMAPTVGAGISRVAASYAVINSGLAVQPVVGTRDAHVRMIAVHEPRPHAVDVETLAIAANVRVRRATPDGTGAVRFERTGPEPSYRAAFERLLGCPVAYGRQEDRLYFTRATWDARPVTAHPAFAKLVSFIAEPVLDRLVPSELTPSVERVIEERLSESRLGAPDVAADLGLSLRTLHRRLAREGHRFGELLDAVRSRVAREALERGRPVGEVALLVGFSETAPFTRAFRRWTGAPPSAHRRGRG